MIIFLFCFAFAESIGDEIVTCGIRYQNSVEGYAWISNCIFSDISGQSNGGAICLLSSLINANINFTSFDNCSATGETSYGGAVFGLAKQIFLYSVCSLRCSAKEGSLFYLLTSDLNVYILYSISAIQCFHEPSNIHGAVSSHKSNLLIRYFNLSEQSAVSCQSAFDFVSANIVESFFVTLFNLSHFSNILESSSLRVLFNDSNIISNDCQLFVNLLDGTKGFYLTYCVFEGNRYDEFGTWYAGLDYFVFDDCWISDNGAIPTGRHFTFFNCSYSPTNTLNLVDPLLFSDGLSCGIRRPSPSISPSHSISQSSSSESKALSGGVIAAIVIVSALFTVSLAVGAWFYTQNAANLRLKTDAQTITLLRDIETSYG